MTQADDSRQAMSRRPVIAFTSVRAPYGWLGNMSPYPLTVEALGTCLLPGTWRTSEALFQATRFDDASIHEEIRTCKSPMQVKMIAKQHAARMIVVPRGPQDLSCMEQVLRLKLAQHPDLRRQLGKLPTDALIVENVTTRGVTESNVFWGAALINGEWVGENRLGRLWMDLRHALTPQVDAQIAMFGGGSERNQ